MTNSEDFVNKVKNGDNEGAKKALIATLREKIVERVNRVKNEG